MAQSIDLSTLAASLANYYRDYAPDFYMKSLTGVPIMPHLTTVVGQDEIVLPKLLTQGLVQPYREAFEPGTNVIDQEVSVLKLRYAKADIKIVPQELQATWMGKVYAAKQAGFDPLDLPFEAFIMEAIQRQITADIENSILFKGVYNSAGTTPVAVADGFLKLISDAITATTITAVATGIITQSTTEDAFKLVFDAVSDPYKLKPLKLFCSPTLKLWYQRDYQATYGALPYNQSFEKMYLDGTQCEIVGTTALTGSQRIIIVPQENIVVGMDNATDSSNIKIEQFERILKLMIDFKIGMQFVNLSEVWVNNQA